MAVHSAAILADDSRQFWVGNQHQKQKKKNSNLEHLLVMAEPCQLRKEQLEPND
jgi:hypothetical protein